MESLTYDQRGIAGRKLCASDLVAALIREPDVAQTGRAGLFRGLMVALLRGRPHHPSADGFQGILWAYCVPGPYAPAFPRVHRYTSDEGAFEF